MDEIYPIRYSMIPCPNCERLRVEEYNNGDFICEKCGWNLEWQKEGEINGI